MKTAINEDIPEYWKNLLSDYRNDLLDRRKPRSVRDQIRHCTGLVSYLASAGIDTAEGVTAVVIAHYYEHAAAIGDGYTCLYSCRYFLEFLARRGFIPGHRPYALTAPVQAQGAGFALGVAQMDKLSALNSEKASVRMAADEFWESASSLVEYLRCTYGYNPTALRNNYTAHLQMLYVFLSELKIDYTWETSSYWMDIMDAFPKNKTFGLMRRYCMDVFRSFLARRNSFSIHTDTISHRNPGKIVELPEWSGRLLDEFLLFSKEEGKAPATLDLYKTAGISFFLYTQEQGISSPRQITPQMVKAFNVSAARKSSNGKNNYQSYVRRLLLYLFENGYTRIDLSLSVAPQRAKSRRIVEILSGTEVQQIYAYCRKASAPLEIRDSAYLLLGLLMGLRASDIVSLRFSDIDWKKRTISITQQKTYRPLALPMPVAAGNRIYLYLKNSRPESSLDYIFLSSKAPYGKAHISGCEEALRRAVGRKCFHILRRTFATGLLNAGAGTDTIKDSLGHATMDTVNRYLSVGEAGMRECCLPLERTVKPFEAKA